MYSRSVWADGGRRPVVDAQWWMDRQGEGRERAGQGCVRRPRKMPWQALKPPPKCEPQLQPDLALARCNAVLHCCIAALLLIDAPAASIQFSGIDRVVHAGGTALCGRCQGSAVTVTRYSLGME